LFDTVPKATFTSSTPPCPLRPCGAPPPKGGGLQGFPLQGKLDRPKAETDEVELAKTLLFNTVPKAAFPSSATAWRLFPLQKNFRCDIIKTTNIDIREAWLWS